MKLSRALNIAARGMDLPAGQLLAIAAAVARQQDLPGAGAAKRASRPAARNPAATAATFGVGPMSGARRGAAPVASASSLKAVAASRELLTRVIDLLA